MDWAQDFWGDWTVADFAGAIGTPLTIVIMTLIVGLWSARREERNRKAAAVVKKRVELWDQIAGPLNDIYTYMLFVGHWKTLKAAEVIERKRNADKIVYAYRPFFTDAFYDAYMAFMNASFEHYGKWGTDACLRTLNIRPQDDGLTAEAFSDENNAAAIHKAYFALLSVAAHELDLDVSTDIAAPETPTSRQQIALPPNPQLR